MMARKHFYFALFGIMAMQACQTTDTTQFSDLVTFRYGTSFGECLGYCQTEMYVQGSEARVKMTSFQNDKPDLYYSYDLEEGERYEIYSTFIAVQDSFNQLEEVIGCPDCADGGAEWITVESPTGSKTVNIEYDSSHPEIQAFLDLLRQYHNQLVDTNY